MIATVIIVGLSIIAAVFTAQIIFFRAFSREKRHFIQTLKLYFEPPAPDQQSEFSALVDQIAYRIGKAAAASVTGSLMGNESAEARRQKAVEAAVTEDVLAGADPRIGAIMSAFPRLSKKLTKNPDLLTYAMQMIAPALNSKPAKQNGSNPDQPVLPLEIN